MNKESTRHPMFRLDKQHPHVVTFISPFKARRAFSSAENASKLFHNLRKKRCVAVLLRFCKLLPITSLANLTNGDRVSLFSPLQLGGSRAVTLLLLAREEHHLRFRLLCGPLHHMSRQPRHQRDMSAVALRAHSILPLVTVTNTHTEISDYKRFCCQREQTHRNVTSFFSSSAIQAMCDSCLPPVTDRAVYGATPLVYLNSLAFAPLGNQCMIVGSKEDYSADLF